MIINKSKKMRLEEELSSLARMNLTGFLRHGTACLTERVKQGRRHPEKKIPSLLKKRLDGLVLKGEPSRGNFCPLILVLLMKQIFILLPLDNPSDIQNMSWSPRQFISYGLNLMVLRLLQVRF